MNNVFADLFMQVFVTDVREHCIEDGIDYSGLTHMTWDIADETQYRALNSGVRITDDSLTMQSYVIDDEVE